MPFKEINGQRIWIPQMSPKGYLVMACDRRDILLHGARKTTKSNTCQNMLIHHAWQHDGATVGVFSRILKSGAEGCYNDLTKRNGRMDEWISSGIGIRYTKEPTFERDTQMRYFRIRNRHGGEAGAILRDGRLFVNCQGGAVAISRDGTIEYLGCKTADDKE